MNINEEQDLFYANLGRCIAQWSHVEDALYGVFSTAIAKPNEERQANLAVQASFYSVNLSEGKFNITNAAVRFRVIEGMTNELTDPRRRLLGIWELLMKKADKRRTKRNQIAHFQVLTDVHAAEGKRLALRPAIFNPNGILRPSRPFHCAELHAICRSFGRLGQDLSAFSYALGLTFGQRAREDDYEEQWAGLTSRLSGRVYEGQASA
ncbi:hypothetical protein RPMA_18890 [Tardiphaga alba]|uniref:HEPN AbiU2-like domain-containing protein n=1 Tax=Tardiphaga alba TaxID=340268 RepID=A0ABX8AA81_9BRAD|nr:hypothetical protein [Tardiphaga alba]QUS40666.1 hypothetical protein RPMA_18890 [Tardiphaga alba]